MFAATAQNPCRLLDDTPFAQKRIEFNRAEIGQDFIVPAHRGGLGLTGRRFISSKAVRSEVTSALP